MKTAMIHPQGYTVSQATYDFLRSVGIDTMFGNPGSTELPMFRNFPSDMRYILGLQESTVVGMADGYARNTGNAACVNLHSAAGVGHALGAVFTAFKNHAPLVIIAGQQARSILPYEPFLFAERAAEFPRPYVKWAIEPGRAEDVPAAIARAYQIAMQTPRGPTFVSIPSDDWDRPASPVIARKISRMSICDPAIIDEIATALDAATRPAFVVGAQVADGHAWNEVIALAERHTAGVFNSPLSARSGFPEDHPLFRGFLEAFRESIVDALRDYDLVLVIGAPMFLYHVEGHGPFLNEGTCAYQLTNDPNMATWPPIGTSVVGDIKAGVRQLLHVSRGMARDPLPARPRPRAPDPAILDDDLLISRIEAHRPPDSLVVEEAPGSRGAVQRHIIVKRPDTYHTMASGGLGWGVPAAVGMALANPHRRVIAIIGDGSTMYSPQAMWTAAQFNLPVLFIVIRNGGYRALVQYGRHKFGLQRTVGTRLPDLDYVAAARSYGLPGKTVTSPEGLDAALVEGLKTHGPSLLEVYTVDRAEAGA